MLKRSVGSRTFWGNSTRRRIKMHSRYQMVRIQFEISIHFAIPLPWAKEGTSNRKYSNKFLVARLAVELNTVRQIDRDYVFYSSVFNKQYFCKFELVPLLIDIGNLNHLRNQHVVTMNWYDWSSHLITLYVNNFFGFLLNHCRIIYLRCFLWSKTGKE